MPLMNNKLEKIKTKLKMFTGWDFSDITSDKSMESDVLSWSYMDIVRQFVKQSSAMLDLGTGGGEFLLSLSEQPEITCATEGYRPNYELALTNLKPRGIDVRFISDDLIPFDDESFDLIINRHESYNPQEVFRVLKSGGVYITQQVGGLNDKELNIDLGAPESEFSFWNLDSACSQLEEFFKINDRKEELVRTHFRSIEAVCFYLNAVPWQIRDFSIEKYESELLNIDKRIENDGKYSVTCHRFLIQAVKREEK